MDIEVGSSRQASTFDFGAKELTNRVVCHLLFRHVLIGLVRSLIDLREGVGHRVGDESSTRR